MTARHWLRPLAALRFLGTLWQVRGFRLMGLLTIISTCGGAPVNTEPDPPGLRVLFIGNSLTYWNDMPEMVRWMLETAGVAVGRIESVAYPNAGLEDHWGDGPARTRIAEGDFDVVVLQQGPSATEGRPSLLDFSSRFAEEIRAAGGQAALYMVWPSAVRAFDFDGVSDSYQTAAQQASALLFPAGEAWRAAWRRDSTLALYGPDAFHPSALGSYLAALVIFEQLADAAPTSLPAVVPAGGDTTTISDELALLLQEAAAEANATFALTHQ